MRNYIISSIANVIRRCSAAAVDMSRMDYGSTSYLWHTQLCAVVQQPAGDAQQRRHGRLLTSVVNTNEGNGTQVAIGNLLPKSLVKVLKKANERLFVETTGSNGQHSGSPRVS